MTDDICKRDENCDMHTAFCVHKDRDGNEHNVHCFTHETCWFDKVLNEYWELTKDE